MDKKKLLWINVLIKATILFVISALLVLGFWFHSIFYQYGLIPLLAIGGIVTLLIILLTSRILSSNMLIKQKVFVTFDFTEKERTQIIKGEKKAQMVIIGKAQKPRLGSIIGAMAEGERFATLHITDIRRENLQYLDDNELKALGYYDRKDFEMGYKKKHRIEDNTLAYIIYFDIEHVQGGD